MSTAPPVVLEMPDLPAELAAGERTPLAVRITRPSERSQPVLLRQIRCNCPHAVLANDLFLRDTEVRPGESYWITLGLEVRRPGHFSFRDLEVEIGEPEPADRAADARLCCELYALGDRVVPVRPSLRQELAVELEPICSYEQGTKVVVGLAHNGHTTFEDVRLRLEPSGAVRAGKGQVYRETLAPQAKEQLEAVVAPGRLTVHVTARAEGQPASASWELAVPARVQRPEGREFRFLEPHGFSRDTVALFRLDEDDRATEVLRRDGIYAVRGQERYRLVICPDERLRPDERHRVSSVRLRELPSDVHVNESATRTLPDRWEFEIFVCSNALLSRRVRLYYDMKTQAGILTGEIHLAVRPPALRHLKLAATVGAAVTLHSAGVLAALLVGNDPDWLQELAGFNPLAGGTQFWFLTSIPLAWAGLRLIDWLQYCWKA